MIFGYPSCINPICLYVLLSVTLQINVIFHRNAWNLKGSSSHFTNNLNNQDVIILARVASDTSLIHAQSLEKQRQENGKRIWYVPKLAVGKDYKKRSARDWFINYSRYKYVGYENCSES